MLWLHFASFHDACYRVFILLIPKFMWLYLEMRNWRRLHEVKKVRPWSNRINVLRGRDIRELVLCLHHVRTQWKGNHLRQRREFFPDIILLAPWSWTSSLKNCEKRNFGCLSHPAYIVFCLVAQGDWYKMDTYNVYLWHFYCSYICNFLLQMFPYILICYGFLDSFSFTPTRVCVCVCVFAWELLFDP